MAYEFDYTESNDDRYLILGDDRTIEITAYDGEGLTQDALAALIAAGTATPLNVTGYTLRFAVKKTDKASDPALLNKTTGGGGITITGTYNASQALNTQRIVVTFPAADSDVSATSLKEFTYRYSLKRTDSGNETTLAFGDFEFKATTTRA